MTGYIQELRREKCMESKFVVISHQGDHQKLFNKNLLGNIITHLLKKKRKADNRMRITLSESSNSSYLDCLC